MILGASPFASKGYVWDSDGAESGEELAALHAAGHGPEALVVVDVSADTAFGRAPGPILIRF